MPSKYLLSAYAVLGAVLSTLLTYSILTIILRGRDYIISAPLLQRKFRYREVKQLASSRRTQEESYGTVKSRFKSGHSGSRV